MEQFKTVKMNWFDYWIGHCWMTGWQSIRSNFRMWGDLMGSNYENYALPRTVKDAEAECIDWFWTSLNEDDTYPKEFLEYLRELCRRIETGEEKTYPIDLDKFGELMEVSEEDFDTFMEMVDKPAEPIPGLIELMNRTPPWDETNETL